MTKPDTKRGGEPGNDKASPKSQASMLVELALQGHTEVFCTPDGTAYADVFEGDDKRRTLPLASKQFHQHLRHQYYRTTDGGAPTPEALQSAVSILDAKARFDGGPPRDVHLRVARIGDQIYVDMCDLECRVIEVSAKGYRIISSRECPARFFQPSSALPLPEPAAEGDIDRFRDIINSKRENDFVMGVGWLLGVLQGKGAYACAAITGAQGSAKSTLARALRNIIDPNAAPLRSVPKSPQDLFIAASRNAILAYDNLSYLSPEMSDAFCTLATGGGFATRELYTNLDEIVISVARPYILNGIEGFASRPDVVDRAAFIELCPIPDDERKPDEEVEAAFRDAHSYILAALLEAAAEGLRRERDVKLARLPRMATFARWVTACEVAFWPEGTFLAAYEANIAAATGILVENDVVSTAIIDFIKRQPRWRWRGPARVLLTALTDSVADPALVRSKAWPADAPRLSKHLKRHVDPLKSVGVSVTFGHDGDSRYIEIYHEQFQTAGNAAEPHGCSTVSTVGRDNGTNATNGRPEQKSGHLSQNKFGARSNDAQRYPGEAGRAPTEPQAEPGEGLI